MIEYEFCADEIVPKARVANMLNPIRLPIERFPFTTKILPNPIVIIDDNKTKKLVVEIC